MTKLFRYLSAYIFWVTDLGLALWLLLVTRTVYLGFLALSFRPGALAYAHRVDFADKVLMLFLGLGWLVFMIVTESYYRAGAAREDLFKRFARITGPVLLSVFCVDLLLVWLQGGSEWLRWIILAAELGIGIILVTYFRSQPKPKLT